MHYLWEALLAAWRLVSSADREVVDILSRSLEFAALATLLAALVSVPLGIVLALGEYRLKRLLAAVLATLTGVPTVIVGLVLFGLLSRQGPLGSWRLLFTPAAVIAGEFCLAVPIITYFTFAALEAVDPLWRLTARTLGATRVQEAAAALRTARRGVAAAVAVGFARAISEVGAATILGGNIRGSTRTITTAIALETSKGEFALGLALGGILISVFLLLNVLLLRLRGR
ncbi:MAG: ABC transporter permease [Deinococcus sp.]|nr:ABC transporter permease [Deinococcus sp.]